MLRIELKYNNLDPDIKIKRYVDKKIGNLEKFIPRAQRGLAMATVMVGDDPNGREHNRYTCEVILNLVGTEIVCHDGTINVYAAIDIVEAKVKTQLIDYKEKTSPRQSRLRLLKHWHRRARLMSEDSEE